VALLIAAGEDPYVVSRRLGHASIKTTFDGYGHLFEGRDRQAGEALDVTGRAALEGSPADTLQTPAGGEVLRLGG
jgi:hypothetical protein